MTVLGKSPAWADAGGACSGYLIESGDTCLLLDCGPGVLGKLRAVCDYASVDAVVLSHLHADHLLDLVPYASALIYGPRWAGGAGDPPRPLLLAPPGAADAFARLSAAAGMGAEHMGLAFELREYAPDGAAEVGALHLRFHPVPHYVASHAVELADEDARLTFSADCGPNEGLVEFAAGTGLLLIEATLTERAIAGDAPVRGHLTPREAGEHGRRARAARLVLTHISDELDVDAAREAAVAAFGGEVDVAAEGAVYEL
jgi:ribonuclease BN (tRNA processing enzyme)